MKRMIRPGGLLGFVVIVVAVGLFWFVAAGWLLKLAIEEGGTRIVGAKVELADADVSFLPLGFHLEGLQVTDPDQPMRNMVELKTVAGNVKLAELLMGQVIIEELEATGLRFNSARKHSGAIVKEKPAAKKVAEKASAPAPEEAKDSGIDLSAVKDALPSADEILAREPLITAKRAKALQEGVETHRAALKESFAALPDDARVKEYERRIQELKGLKIKSLDDLKKHKATLDQLKKDIREDKQAITNVRNSIKGAKGELGDLYKALQGASSEDLSRLKSQYTFDREGASNVVGLIFGDTAQEWLETIRVWSSQIQRVLPSEGETPAPVAPPRSGGRFVHFSSERLPDFLIQRALVDMHLSMGDVAIELKNVTHQPDVLGKPMLLNVSGTKLATAEQLDVHGVFDHVKPGAEKDTLQWLLGGWQLQDVEFAKRSSSPLALKQAQVRIDGQATLSGGKLTAFNNASFAEARWSGKSEKGFGTQLAKALKPIHEFRVDGTLEGSVSSPKLSMSSDLDDMLKKEMKAQLAARQAELEKELKDRLNAEIEKAAGPYKEQLAELAKGEATFKQRSDKLEEMLKAELDAKLDAKKEEVVDKLKDKLRSFKR